MKLLLFFVTTILREKICDNLNFKTPCLPPSYDFYYKYKFNANRKIGQTRTYDLWSYEEV